MLTCMSNRQSEIEEPVYGIDPKRSFQVARDGDRYAVRRNVGISVLSFKVTTADRNG